MECWTPHATTTCRRLEGGWRRVKEVGGMMEEGEGGWRDDGGGGRRLERGWRRVKEVGERMEEGEGEGKGWKRMMASEMMKGRRG